MTFYPHLNCLKAVGYAWSHFSIGECLSFFNPLIGLVGKKRKLMSPSKENVDTAITIAVNGLKRETQKRIKVIS